MVRVRRSGGSSSAANVNHVAIAFIAAIRLDGGSTHDGAAASEGVIWVAVLGAVCVLAYDSETSGEKGSNASLAGSQTG